MKQVVSIVWRRWRSSPSRCRWSAITRLAANSIRTGRCCCKGAVTKVEWVNPHAWIHLAAKEVTVAGEKKTLNAPEEWAVEGGTPNTLLRRGINRDSLTPGTEIVVDGYQTRDHSLLRGNGRNITFADGRKLFMGSSGTGAPKDGADPTEPPR